jgi:hypothetical protein
LCGSPFYGDFSVSNPGIRGPGSRETGLSLVSTLGPTKDGPTIERPLNGIPGLVVDPILRRYQLCDHLFDGRLGGLAEDRLAEVRGPHRDAAERTAAATTAAA